MNPLPNPRDHNAEVIALPTTPIPCLRTRTRTLIAIIGVIVITKLISAPFPSADQATQPSNLHIPCPMAANHHSHLTGPLTPPIYRTTNHKDHLPGHLRTLHPGIKCTILLLRPRSQRKSIDEGIVLTRTSTLIEIMIETKGGKRARRGPDVGRRILRRRGLARRRWGYLRRWQRRRRGLICRFKVRWDTWMDFQITLHVIRSKTVCVFTNSRAGITMSTIMMHGMYSTNHDLGG